MTSRAPTSISDRLVAGAFGVFTGACYGLVLALIALFFVTSFPGRLILISSVVFGLVGFIWGSLVEDAFIGLTHLIWGLIAGWFDTPEALDDEDLSGNFRGFLLLGFGTGIVLLVWSYM